MQRRRCFVATPVHLPSVPSLNEPQELQRLLMEKNQELQTALTMEDLMTAVSKVNKSVNHEDLKRYDAWMEEFGSA